MSVDAVNIDKIKFNISSSLGRYHSKLISEYK